MRAREALLHAFGLFTLVKAACYDPSPAFPVPTWKNGLRDLTPCFSAIEARLREVVASEKYDASSFSVEVTSQTETLWSSFHTARKRNESRPGVNHVNGDSQYRIASITKVFTTLLLLQLHESKDLDLDTPILHYIPELAGQIPWKDITLRALASQLSGIPREFAQSDLINELEDPTAIGLPPATKNGLPKCDEYSDYHPACNATDLLETLKKLKPLLAPNQLSTYSNVNFELIGLAIERVSGKEFKDIVQKQVFDEISMNSSSLDTPSDKHAVIPLGDHYWDVDAGVQNPTGGIYSSSADMSRFLRYVLGSYNALATGVNWMMPASWSTGMQSFYGMPFEIFRTDAILKESRRPVTFVTKSGGLPGYQSRIILMPEYGLGLTILVAGTDEGTDLLSELQEIVTVGLVRAAEEIIWRDVNEKYSGFYTAVNSTLNSSVALTAGPFAGLVLTSFISNGTDVYHDVIAKRLVDDSKPWRTQLVPTLLFKDEKSQRGEIWRLLGVPLREDGKEKKIWSQFCTTDIDVELYAGLPVNEFVFWHDEGVVEMPAWKVKLKLSDFKEQDGGRVVVQG